MMDYHFMFKKEETVIFSNMDKAGGYYMKWNNAET